MLDAAEIRRRFPQFRVADDEQGYLERDAGFVRPEECVRAHLALAEAHGAEICCNEEVLGFDASDREVIVTTGRDRYAADKLIVAAGPWLPSLLTERLARPFAIYRQALFWFDIDEPIAPWLPERSPVFIWELQGKKQVMYGLPAIDGVRGGADDFLRKPLDLAPFLSGVSRRCVKALTCLYTVTPDFGFVIDTHPDCARVMIVSPCSGHGFKHSPAIGEALSEWVIDGRSRFDLAPFALKRFLS